MNTHSNEISVRLKNIKCNFGLTTVIDNLSLDISKGEIVSLVGRSGCGKSTLLRIIAGVQAVNGGSVELGGEMVDGFSFIEPEHRSVGLVFQDYALFPHLNVRDNVLFGLRHQARRGGHEIVTTILQRVGIEHLAERFPHSLSGGEQQRTALARALAPEPAILLMDEPFSNLDQGLKERVRAETLSLLRGLGATVIMVTHDPHEALSLGDRVVLMRSGKIVQSADPRHLYHRPNSAYAADFFCPSAKVQGEARNGFIETALGRFVRPACEVEDGPCILFIRPHAIRICDEFDGLRARIIDRAFLGDRERLTLRFDGIAETMVADVTEPLPADLGHVRAKIVSERLLVF
ncbi:MULTISPECIES: ABC transporter ATP-binding protein [unclassified Rhizobium]|uniref:ABC transporter ATP-binding protein n=1 Tax=unclassified Rhizobium TaxID=2613769 RepID=UPI001ADA38F6|nr:MULTISPECIES: ABC transporter ATP-binding protein [unclassified Rhizobium]MBO9123817.1 ABC transporter ATP-binding protein [Rhizobium sp. 16-488-2b]MBO9174349.1 ABC transporter ATP-binding protein [Rhizobium sp. 16-488-2a]